VELHIDLYIECISFSPFFMEIFRHSFDSYIEATKSKRVEIIL
jgi:hypothetical protein